MITCTAIFEGRIKPGCEERFFEEVQTRLLPLWRQFPKASNVRYSRIASTDAEAPPIVMIQQIDYPSLADIEAALASPVRTAARAVTLDILQMFEGRFYHLVGSDDLAAEGR